VQVSESVVETNLLILQCFAPVLLHLDKVVALAIISMHTIVAVTSLVQIELHMQIHRTAHIYFANHFNRLTCVPGYVGIRDINGVPAVSPSIFGSSQACDLVV
jgi:hypothetical protein